jgi:PAS domain S-box-containing protein
MTIGKQVDDGKKYICSPPDEIGTKVFNKSDDIFFNNTQPGQTGTKKEKMKDHCKTKKQLISELENLRQQVAVFEKESKHRDRNITKSDESDAIYKKLYENNPYPMWVYDLETLRFLAVNKAAVRHYGYTREEFLKMTIKDISPPEDVPALLNNISQVSEGFDDAGIWRHILKDGSTIYVEITSHTLNFEERKAELVLAHNVTKRIEAEQLISESEERYRIISELTSDFAYAFRVNADGELTSDWVTGAMARITGFTAEELAAKGGWEAMIYPGDISIPMGQLKTLLGGKASNVEYRIIHKNGETRWMRDYGIPVWSDETNRVTHIYGAVQDITDRKHYEKELQESEERYKTLTNNLSVGIYRNTPGSKGTFIEANPTIVKMFGFSNRDEFLSVAVSDLYQNPDDRKKFNSIMLQKGYARNEELHLRKKDGSPFIASVSSVGVKDESGQIKYYDGMIEDISERKHLESQLQQAQKMEAIGTLAGGIAHDFNNILAAILGYTELAILDIPEDVSARQYLEQSLKSAYRARDLVSQILAFSRQGETELRPVQIDSLISEALKMLRATLPTSIEIRQLIEKDAGYINADPTQIHQVLLNLSTNASYAMRDEGGILDICLTSVEVDADTIKLHSNLQPGPYLKLSVGDTGQGMDPKVVHRIFDPYFTTKEKGEGTGLGLAVVHGIVKSHGGFLSIESQPKKGTTFHVFFPIIKDRIEPHISAEEPIQKGQGRILFIDDEEVIANLGKKMLMKLGYEVEAKTSSPEALELFRTQPDQFDLVMTDMTMPKMTGEKLAKEIMTIRPDIPIILCTGYSEQITEEKAKELGIKEFAMKPIRIHDIATTIRKALGQ